MGITTSTPYGRQNISWPDFAHEGGSALHGKIVASIGELSDKLTGVWSGEFTKNNGEYIDVEHNFDMDMAELTMAVYVNGEFFQEGSSSSWTITQLDTNNIRITNNTSQTKTFFVYVLGFNIKKVIGDASTTNKGLMNISSQTFAGEKTFNGNIKTDVINERSSGEGVIIDSVKLKDGNIETVGTGQFTQQGSTPATPASGKSKFYVKSDGVAYILNSDGIETPVGSGSTIERVSHTSHGFIVGTPLYDAGTNFAKGNCTDAAKAEVIAMVSRVIDANTFEVITDGIPSGGLVAACFKGGVLPADGAVCFLSDEDGKLTTTEPSTVGQVSKPIFFVRSVDATYAYGYFKNMRGSTVGGTNLYTSIGLANNATTTIQNVSAHTAGTGGFIEGYIQIDATTDYVATFKIPFQKPLTGTAYTLGSPVLGGTIPDGTSFDITTGGLIQVTLPSVTGFSSATAVFAMQAAMAGAQLPLSIDSALITYTTPESPRGWAISTNADYTFTATGASASRARVTATSANRSVTLPSTGVKAGANIEVATSCSGGYTIAIKSSDTTTIDTLIGDKGRIRLVALQDTPTAGSHWEVVEVEDALTLTPTFTFGGGATVASSLFFLRKNLQVSCSFEINEVTSATATGTCASSAGIVPAKFRPTLAYGSEVHVMCGIRDNGTLSDTPGAILVNTSGSITLQKAFATSSFSGGAGGATGAPRKTTGQWRIV